MRIAFGILSFLLIISCTTEEQHSLEEFGSMDSLIAAAPTAPPDWMKEVVWYQIFPERFRNGDPTNDPRAQDIDGSYPGFVPETWSTTPWSHDWYAPDPYWAELEGSRDFNDYPVTTFGQKSQLRRYGGDLQGVLDQIDYLEELGITAVYFNPLNDAPSLHKYDPRHWRHIDRNFGPDPDGDAQLMAAETPDDPNTWSWTAADQQFLQVIQALHEKGIRVIMDYSWNHTGHKFWAIDDIRSKGESSKYTDWYWIDAFDDPDTEADELDYQGWIGIKSLPEIKETQRLHFERMEPYDGDVYSEEVKYHIFTVTQRWMDPNGDGDPSDGVDGFRLDVAAELPLGWWRQYRGLVKGINPKACLIGEIWWEQWPDLLIDPKPWLGGDIFDAVMNYRWYRAARNYFAYAPDTLKSGQYTAHLDSIYQNIDTEHRYSLMNMSSSHDAPRLSTSLFNKNPYKFNSGPGADSTYMIHRPDEAAYGQMKLFLGHQYTFVGAPQIWAGDEMGMWGADDPDCRKPLTWPDLEFDPEQVHPLGLERPVDSVAFDFELFEYYKKLISMRQKFDVFKYGGLEFIPTGSDLNVLAYKRFTGEELAYVFFNLTDDALRIPVPEERRGTWVVASPSGKLYVEGAAVGADLEPKSWTALVRLKSVGDELGQGQ